MANCAVSPGWFIPNSTTAKRSLGRSRNKVKGKPMSLFRLPWVTRVHSSPTAALKIEAIISFTVVFPLLPVTKANGIEKVVRQALANSPKPFLLSGTQTAAKLGGHFSRLLMSAAAAPALATSPKKSCASNRSPANAINNSPASIFRLSVPTLEISSA